MAVRRVPDAGRSDEREPLLPSPAVAASTDASSSSSAGPSHRHGDGKGDGRQGTKRRRQGRSGGAVDGGTRTATTPLPRFQLFVLGLMRFGEPISFTFIFPFINEMVVEVGVTRDKEQVGYYAGMIESIFSLCQFATVLFWGRLSDRVGRKPVLISGLCGVSVSALLFGLSTTFWQMVVARCLAGALNGNVAIIKSVVGEICDKTNRARSFALLPLFFALGSTIGPIIGGYLSHPVERYPDIFGGISLFKKYPYLFPCLVCAGITWISIIVGTLFLEESLERKKVKKRLAALPEEQRAEEAAQEGSASQSQPGTTYGSVASQYGDLNLGKRRPAIPTSNNADPDSRPLLTNGVASSSTLATEAEEMTGEVSAPTPVPSAPPSFVEILSDPLTLRVLLTYALLALKAVALEATLVLFLFTPIHSGGLSFSESQIGTALAVSGASTMLVQLFLFPPAQQLLGTVRLYRLSLGLYPLICCLLPFANVLAKRGKLEEAESVSGPSVTVIVLVGLVLLLKTIANMAFACNMIVVNQCARTGSSLGAINGIAQMVASAMRFIGPGAASTLFALSASRQLLGGYLIWVCMVLLGLAATGVSCTLRERDGDDEEEEREQERM